MTDFVIDAANSVIKTAADTGPALTLDAGDMLTVEGGGVLATAGIGQAGVQASIGGVTITVGGTIQADESNGINALLGGNTITIASGGQVFGKPGADGWYGIRLRGATGGDNTVINGGLISGLAGISQAGTAGNLIVVNTGVITGYASDDAAAIAAESGNNSITNNGIINGNVFLGTGDDFYDGTSGIINGKVILNEGNDSAIGSAAGEIFFGGAGDDTLTGNGGDDTLVGGEGSDTLDGGSGSDTAVFGDDQVHVDLIFGLAFSGFETDTLVGIENITTGAGNDDLVGDGSANILNTGAGNDSLIGGGGNDTLIGGAGTDQAVFAGYGSAGGTSVNIMVDLSVTGPQDTGEGLDTLSGVENVITGDGDDILIGDEGANTLSAGNGNDTLTGGLGDDTLLGGAGNDTAVYLGLNGAGATVPITVDLSRTDAQGTGEGLDTLSGIENVTTGAGNDHLTGNDAANTLDGGAGSDVLTGGLGDDTYIGGAGSDLAVFLGLDADGGVVNVTVDLTINSAQNTGEGLDTFVGIEHLNAGAGNDTLAGNGGTNDITGGAGNDILSGGSGDDWLTDGDGTSFVGMGNDSLYGGLGNDVFFVGDGADLLDGGDGTDAAYVTGDVSQATFVSMEVIYGTSDDETIKLDQSAFDNLIEVYADLGADTIVLGGGTYDFGRPGLTIEGFETIKLTADGTILKFAGTTFLGAALSVDAVGVKDTKVVFDNGVLTEMEIDALFSNGFAEITDTAQTLINVAPSAVQLNNAVLTLPEDMDVSGEYKVADIEVTDDGFGTLTYTVGGPDSGSFHVKTGGGGPELRYKGPALDAEGPKTQFSVTVEVADPALSAAPVTADYTLTVTDVNEFAPVIASNGGSVTAVVQVAEGGTFVTTVMATDQDATGSLQFFIVGGGDASKFTIDPSTGVLSFDTAPDAETPSSAAGTNDYEVVVQVADGDPNLPSTPIDTQTITVQVTDVDEVAPVFTSADSASVDEGSTTVTTIVANDASGAVTYALGGGGDNDLFTIDAATGHLAFKAAPDRETGQQSYVVTILASDGTNETTQTLTVAVTDVNEAPAGLAVGTPLQLLENDAAPAGGTVVATVSVLGDPDGPGPFSAYSYAVAGAQASKFELVEGNLFLKAGESVDAEASLDLTVTATNVDDATHVVTQTLTLAVTDVDDAAPVITSADTVFVPEGTQAVTTVTATDADGTGTVTYALENVGDVDLFEIDPISGALTFKDAPNFETDPASYTVDVIADDGTNQTTQTLVIAVMDVNEAPTGLTLQNVVATISEAVVFTDGIKAANIAVVDDALGDENVDLTGPDADKFEVRGIGGNKELWYIGEPFDAEGPQTTFSVTVQITDPDLGGTALTADYTLTVSDLNEFPVQITSAGSAPFATVVLDEGQTAVTAVTAEDGDAEANLIFTLSGADADLFTYDIATGQLAFKTAPDAEAPDDTDGDNVYDVVVTVSDGSSSDSQPIAVVVMDQNEPPTGLTVGTPVALVENEAAPAGGTIVASVAVEADPDDGGPFLDYAYTIVGAQASKFEVVEGNLVLKAGESVDAEAALDLTVTATNLENTSHQVSKSITLQVIDADDEAPVFTSAADVSVAEGVSAVITVAATAQDGTGAVTYALQSAGDSDLFTIDPQSGELSFKEAPDFETEPTSYSVTVIANDGSNQSSQTVTVTVTDVNEAPTSVVLANEVVAIFEDANVTDGVKVADIVVADDALGSLAYVLNGSDASQFEVRDGASGKELWYIGDPLDAEGPQAQFAITVEVSDPDLGGAPATVAYTLVVGDANEAPTGLAVGPLATLIENQAAPAGGTVVASVAVQGDPDGSGPFSAYSYAVTGAQASKLEVVGGNLLLKTGESVDAEISHDLTVTATNLNNASHVVTQSFTLVVTDVEEPILGDGDDNNLVGDDGDNKLFGLGGNDTLTGGLGNDTLDGGGGIDTAVLAILVYM
jgi:Ca2+-binding RTX toxin-like protein